MADVITNLRLNATQHDQQLTKSMGKLRDFGNQNLTLNGIMAQGVTGLAKFAGGFGATALAAGAFNAVVMNGSQTLADFVGNNMAAMQSSLRTLASSIATLDFSPFENGLAAVYEKAKQAAEAMDDLGNVMISHGVVGKRYGAQLQEAMTIIRDPNTTKEEKAAARASGEEALKRMREANEEAQKAILRSVKTDVATQNSLDASSITEEDLFRGFALGASRTREEQKARYNKALAAKPVDNSFSRQYMPGGSYIETVDKKKRAEYERNLASWKKEHRTDIVAHTLNEKYTDKELTEKANLFGQTYQIDAQQAQLERTWNRAVNAKQTPTPSPTTKIKPVQSSMDLPAQAEQAGAARTAIASLTEELEKYRQAAAEATTALDLGKAKQGIEDTTNRLATAEIALSMGVNPGDVVQLGQDIAASMEELQSTIPPLTIPVNTTGAQNLAKAGAATSDNWKQAMQAVNSVGGALQNIKNPALNIAGMIAQCIANVALGFAGALARPESQAGGVWGWIAAAAAGLATMTATIVGIKQATAGSYAEGGIVPGGYNGGVDSSYIYASPGEVILNRAQQQNLLGQLDGGGAPNGGGEAYVRGETMYMAINNYLRRTGKKFG